MSQELKKDLCKLEQEVCQKLNDGDITLDGLTPSQWLKQFREDIASKEKNDSFVRVVGAGLAGCEASWQLAEAGISVELYEMKPEKKSPAHHSPLFAELVCSNSLRANGVENAVGLLKEELRQGGSLIMAVAEETAVPAGGALAVDREKFSEIITEKVKNHRNIQVISTEMEHLPRDAVFTIFATGPLTQGRLADEIQILTTALLQEGDSTGKRAGKTLHFYDAAAPIVSSDSIDMNSAYFASRYGKGTPDYINCPLNREEYLNFWQELVKAEEAPVHGFEDSKVFEGCKPIEVEGRRGEETLLFGCLKPVGLPDPKTGKDPHAVVQLRKDNAEGSMYNLVGFQTHLKFPEQKRVFSMIPALKEAEFLRYGVMHRNTYLNAPGLLNFFGQLDPNNSAVFVENSLGRLLFAGQMTGVEGYVESIASGWLVGTLLSWHLQGRKVSPFPQETAVGSLQFYLCCGSVDNFQPMKMNFGLIPPLGYRVKRSPEEKKTTTAKQAKNRILAKRALESFDKHYNPQNNQSETEEKQTEEGEML